MFQNFSQSFLWTEMGLVPVERRTVFRAVCYLQDHWSSSLYSFHESLLVLRNVFQNPRSAAALQGLAPAHQTMGQLEMLLKMTLPFCHLLLMLR